jgi:hypothetical protein
MDRRDQKSFLVGAIAWAMCCLLIRWYGVTLFSAITETAVLYALTLPVMNGCLRLANKSLQLGGSRNLVTMCATVAALGT